MKWSTIVGIVTLILSTGLAGAAEKPKAPASATVTNRPAEVSTLSQPAIQPPAAQATDTATTSTQRGPQLVYPQKAPRAKKPASAEKAQPAAAPVATPVEVPVLLDPAVRRVNAQDESSATRKAGFAAVAEETGTSTIILEREQKRFAAGVGGLLVAHELARSTRKSANDYLLQHARGASWDRIAAEAKVDARAILPKLERLQQAMKQGGSNSSKPAKSRSQS